MDQMLKEKVAIVTGGSSGIGKAISLKFVRQGAKVILVGTNPERGQKALNEIRELVPEAEVAFLQGDVSNEEQSNQIVKEVLDKQGCVDILVNNAGITRDNLLLRMPPEDWDLVLDVNVKSCYNLCRAVIRPMIRARQGKIINMSSVIGLTGNAGQVNYSASKAAVIGFTKALAKELASRNINVNCIAPGYIKTAMTDKLPPEQKKSIFEDIPMRRFGDPEDVANVALFLASDLSSYVTAQVVTVDGGYL
ncbi:MAG: 3-oxoacyl-[acyl-carrier-protein] reductase FabG [Chlamydiae bacterium]|nr:3-oxoacyl-[acyl-carrier-protein] reductase FabG [Chlamydiota bacterium]